MKIYSEDNPIRLVFKIAKELLNTKSTDEAIYEAKVENFVATEVSGAIRID